MVVLSRVYPYGETIVKHKICFRIPVFFFAAYDT